MRRSRRHEALWNGNVEPALRTIFTEDDHIVRWAWRTHHRGVEHLDEMCRTRPDLRSLWCSPRQVEEWVHGPLADHRLDDADA